MLPVRRIASAPARAERKKALKEELERVTEELERVTEELERSRPILDALMQRFGATSALHPVAEQEAGLAAGYGRARSDAPRLPSRSCRSKVRFSSSPSAPLGYARPTGTWWPVATKAPTTQIGFDAMGRLTLLGSDVGVGAGAIPRAEPQPREEQRAAALAMARAMPRGAARHLYPSSAPRARSISSTQYFFPH